ncbi:MAG: dynamin family protein, partial [Synergistaceae bacterium]|nr:dynamin family protein [Synergistaceae bacterium]
MKITTQVLPKFSEIVTLDDDLSYKFVSLYENLKSRPKGLFRRMKSKFAWLIRENASLHEFIETLGEYEDSLNLYDFYAAYNIKFPAETVSWVSHDGTQITDIGDMAELLSAILYDAGKDYYRAVILSPDLVRYRVHHKDLEELRVKIIQQFIYLRICIPVVILGSPETRTKRNVRLSIFGTKKSGKSTIINAMLGDEYSLSSSELPTPCRIIYAEDKIANRNIILEQDGMRKIFPSPEELKNFLSEKFRYAAKHSGSIDNFYVTIPAFPEIFRALTIVDTPGPNFAGAASHHDIAYSEIDYADICLFVMNYSSHLT